MHNFEYYSTPATFTRYLLHAMAQRGQPVAGRVFEPTVGDGAILTAAARTIHGVDTGARDWVTNDLDRRWSANFHQDATQLAVWNELPRPDWVVGNPPFSLALPIIEHAIRNARVGVAMHLRASIHEPLKTGIRRTWMADCPPDGILWLPRFAYQRSKRSGDWMTDTVCACWVIWLSDPEVPQFLDYAPEWVIDELTAETPAFRARMDTIMAGRDEAEPTRAN